ncbi:hypothetical protein RISW2_01675 [Roseivivax isoporae LMG 25204]|uniref:Phytase-like domain-containing protein n=2 Tax=Roseivivax TaxID=93682 RepID=X7F9K8_9RHOB|nr:hypothetical protein RISW2_01675 [Roseivivax isoporae LMG 25204]
MVWATGTGALELTLTGSYALNRPSSLDYDPTFCGLWIANEGPEAILVTLQGDELRRVTSDLFRIKAIAVDGQGLIVADGAGSFQRLDTSGAALGAPFRAEGWLDTEGIVTTEDGTLITVEDDPEYLTWLAPDGTLLRRVDTMTLEPPLSEAQGIARDPRTGHLLIVDDWEGTNALYEFDAEGRLLATESLVPYGLDPEGIAIRPGSGQLFVAFDSGDRIASFDYVPTLPADAPPLPPAADCMMS